MDNIKNDRVIDDEELTAEELEQASGGTFFPNQYSKNQYHKVGISTNFHTFGRDEFFFMGNPISYETANRIVSIANDVSNVINTGKSFNDAIGYTEPVFSAV